MTILGFTMFGMLTFIVTCSLLTMVWTTPGVILVGFRLRAAVMLGLVGMVLTVITSHGFETFSQGHYIQSRVNATLIIWLIPSLMVLVCPYSKKTREKLDHYREIYK